MRVLILTSSDHLYANVVIGHLLRRGIFAGDRVTVVEQPFALPGYRGWSALLRYLRISGIAYVVRQALKVETFRLRRFLDTVFGRRPSSFYPYHLLSPSRLERRRWPGQGAAGAMVRAIQPDLLLSIFSREVLSEDVLRVPPLGALNLHPSLLPMYCGVSPTFWCLTEEQTRTGVTVHAMRRDVDTGPLLAQRVLDVRAGETEHALYLRCARARAEILSEVIQRLREGSVPSAQPLPDVRESYRSLPTREAVRLFHQRGHRFFRLREFLASCEKEGIRRR